MHQADGLSSIFYVHIVFTANSFSHWEYLIQHGNGRITGMFKCQFHYQTRKGNKFFFLTKRNERKKATKPNENKNKAKENLSDFFSLFFILNFFYSTSKCSEHFNTEQAQS